MKIWIVGLPNVGKSTLFNALTKSYAADAANFPFCTIDPNVGVVDVRDERVDQLALMSSSQKTVYSTIKFVDIAGLVRGASKGEGMGNAFLSHIREVDAILQVLRYFNESDVNHVEWHVDPLRDKQIINDELILADLQQIEKKLPQLQRKAKSWDKEVQKEVALLEHVSSVLESWKLMYTLHNDLPDEARSILSHYHFLTFKPFVYVINVSDTDLVRAGTIAEEYTQKLWAPVAVVCATMEQDMIELSSLERDEFIRDLLGVEPRLVPTLDDVISLAFDTVGLMYYFTSGEKETKARTVKKNSTAPEAAGVIHTDFQRGFIKADVVSCSDLLLAWSWSQARAQWKVRLEWKQYVVQDGDVIVFKFNV